MAEEGGQWRNSDSFVADVAVRLHEIDKSITQLQAAITQHDRQVKVVSGQLTAGHRELEKLSDRIGDINRYAAPEAWNNRAEELRVLASRLQEQSKRWDEGYADAAREVGDAADRVNVLTAEVRRSFASYEKELRQHKIWLTILSVAFLALLAFSAGIR